MTLLRRFSLLALIIVILSQAITSFAYTNYISVNSKSKNAIIPKPTISVISESYNKIKISWKPISGASGYKIYRATSSKGKYTNIYTVKSRKTVSYINSGLTTDKIYYYKVQAYRKAGSKMVYSKFSLYMYSKPVLNTPKITVDLDSESNIKVSWSKITGANGYEIYRAITSNGEYSKLYAVESNSIFSYINMNLSPGNFYYKVRAYRNIGSKKVYGNFSIPKFAKVDGEELKLLPAPANFSASTYNYQSVQLYYDVVQNAVKYRIYYSKTPSANIMDYDKFDWASKDCRVIGLDAGTTYYFRVAAVDIANKVGTPTGFVTAKTSNSPNTPPQPKFYLNGIDTVGSKYRMKFYRSTSPIYPSEYEPTFNLYTGTSSTNMAFDTTCDLSQYFYYDVNPGQSLWYGFTANYGTNASTMQKINVAALGIPNNVTADGLNYGGKVNMSWNSVYAASGYNIYYCISGPYPGQSWFDFKVSAGSYLKFVSNTSSTNATLSGIPQGLQYYFIVVPINSSGVEGWYCSYAITGVIS